MNNNWALSPLTQDSEDRRNTSSFFFKIKVKCTEEVYIKDISLFKLQTEANKSQMLVNSGSNNQPGLFAPQLA